MEENFYSFFKNYHKNKDIVEEEKREKSDDFFNANLKKQNREISSKKKLLEQIKADTLQKMAYSNYRVPEKLITDKDFVMNVIGRNEKIQNHLIANSQYYNNFYSKPNKVKPLKTQSKSPLKREFSNEKSKIIKNKTTNSNNLNIQNCQIEIENGNLNRPQTSSIKNVNNIAGYLYKAGDNITECTDNHSSSIKTKRTTRLIKKDKQKIIEEYFSNRDEDYIHNTRKLRMYSSKNRVNIDSNNCNLHLNNENNINNNDISNDLDKSNYPNNEILVTFNNNNNNCNNINNIGANSNNNFKENINIDNDLSNLNNFVTNKETKNRPSTAMFSISSKISLKNHIERIKSKINF